MGIALPFSDWVSVERTVGTRILLEFGSKVTTERDRQPGGREKNFRAELDGADGATEIDFCLQFGRATHAVNGLKRRLGMRWMPG